MKTQNRGLRAWFTALAIVAGACLVVAATCTARADEPAKSTDDALEDLLRKVDDKSNDTPNAEKAKTGSRPKNQAKAKTPATTPKPKTGEDLSTKDKDLDSLLEKLGSSEDKPAPDDKKPPGAGAGPPMPDQPGAGGDKDKDKAKKPDPLAGKDREIDDHIAELAGRRRKKDNRKQSDENSPLSDVIKQMRDVERKLGQEETGEETRKKQSQIVKRLDTLIEEMRSSQSRSRSRSRGLAMGRGQKPGNKPGENPGSNGGNAPFTKPEKPNNKRSLAGGKDEWGHLPPELRQEMDNVMHEEALPSREELVRRYYLSVSRKSLKRSE